MSGGAAIIGGTSVFRCWARGSQGPYVWIDPEESADIDGWVVGMLAEEDPHRQLRIFVSWIRVFSKGVRRSCALHSGPTAIRRLLPWRNGETATGYKAPRSSRTCGPSGDSHATD